MRKKLFSLACGLLLLAGRSAAVQPYMFRTIDVPCSDCPGGIALRTQPIGISAIGEVVGGFTDAVGGQHGFLLSHGRFTSIDVPGSLVGVAGTLPTAANGINAAGDIVGNFTAPYSAPGSTSVGVNDPRYCPAANSPACIKGYMYSHGEYSVVLFPGHPGAFPWHFSPEGDIYGCLHDYDLMRSMFGAVWSRFGDSSLTAGGGELADPTMSFPSSMNNGAAGDGAIVGLWDDMNTPSHRHGFVVQDGEFHSYDFPGPAAPVTLTAIWDINANGQFVGTFIAGGVRHGFLQNPDGGAAIQLDDPDGANTSVGAINPEGVIVGTYTAGGQVHGFFAVPTGN